MSKIYALYGPDERRIDNLKRRIRGYEKMRKDLTNQNRRLNKKNQQLKEQLEASEKARKEAIDKLKTLGKFDGEKCTRSFKLWTADFNELISILDIDKGE